MRNALDIWGWNPSRDIFGFFEELDQQRDARRFHSGAVLTPACDVEESPSHFLISLDMPGISKENIQIEVKDDQLVVTAERSREKTENGAGRHWSERSYGKFHRTFTLGEKVKQDGIEAVYRDGVLRIALAKADEVKPQKISVSDEDKSGLFTKLFSKEAKDTKPELKAATH